MSKKYIAKVERLHSVDSNCKELCVKLPDELMEQLGWKIGDEVEWEETEIYEDYVGGEHKGFTLANRSKQFRDAKEALKNAVSTDME